LPLAREAAPVGAPVFVMSHPDNRFYLLSAGFVARHVLWRTEAGDEAFMTITADFAKGSSGCPVLDERGAVVGIVNNTESIYYDDDGRKKQTDLQMVVKNATPSWAVQSMIGIPAKAEGR
jgi:S1-C subfamily serine protease